MSLIDAMTEAAKAFVNQAKERSRRRRNENSNAAIAWRNEYPIFDPYARTAHDGIGANGLPEATAYVFPSREAKAKEREWGDW